MFVLKHITNISHHYDGYYTGKSYIYQGSRYAVADKDIKNAKVYKTLRNAQKGQKILFENYYFDIEEVKE